MKTGESRALIKNKHERMSMEAVGFSERTQMNDRGWQLTIRAHSLTHSTAAQGSCPPVLSCLTMSLAAACAILVSISCNLAGTRRKYRLWPQAAAAAAWPPGAGRESE